MLYSLLTGAVSKPDEIDENGGNNNLRTTDNFVVIDDKISVKRQEAEINSKYLVKNIEYLEELISKLKESGIQATIISNYY